MNYIDKKIKEILKSKNWTVKKFVTLIDLTENGYTYMINNDSIKVSTLKKIAQVLNTPIEFFFDESNISDTKNIDSSLFQAKYEMLENENEMLKNQITHKDKIISLLEHRIKELEKNK